MRKASADEYMVSVLNGYDVVFEDIGLEHGFMVLGLEYYLLWTRAVLSNRKSPARQGSRCRGQGEGKKRRT